MFRGTDMFEGHGVCLRGPSACLMALAHVLGAWDISEEAGGMSKGGLEKFIGSLKHI